MRSRYLLLLLLLLAPFAAAEKLDLDFTVMGTGGYSHEVAHFSDSPVWWIDNSGSMSPQKVYATFGFGIPGSFYWPSPAYENYKGSVLLSSAFTLKEGDTLKITFSLLSIDQPLYDGAYIALLRDKAVVATLASLPTSLGLSGSDGVTFDPDTAHFRGNVVNLAGLQYGPTLAPLGPIILPGGSTNWITSSYSPGAGTYRLLMGVSETVSQGGPRIPDTAFAVKSIQVHHGPKD